MRKTMQLMLFLLVILCFTANTGRSEGIDSTNHEMIGIVGILDNIDKVPATSLENILQGKFASLFVQSVNGSPGSQQVMSIRNSGLSAVDNFPLVILNGVPIFAEASQITETNPLAAINIDDIATIEVVKDASALAIYGARAANGVIIITTKKADSKSQVNVNLSGGVSLVGNNAYKNVIGGQQEFDRVKTLYDKRNMLYPNNVVDYPLFVSDPNNTFFEANDWQDGMYELGNYLDANFGISGSGIFGFYNVTLGYQSQEGVQQGSKFNRFHLSINSRYNVTEKFGFDFYINGVQMKREEDNSLLSPAYAPFTNNPIFPESVFVADNSLLDENTNNHIYSNAKVFYNISDKLEFSSLVGLVYENYRNDLFSPSTLNQGNITSSAYSGQNQRFVSRTEIAFDNNSSSRKLTAKAGFEVILSQIEDIGITGTRYGSAFSDFVKIVSGYNRYELDGGTSIQKYNLVSGYGTFSYNAFENFNITGSLRADANSQFSEDERLKIFPGLGIDWKFIDKPDGFIQSATIKGGASILGIGNETGNLYDGQMVSIGNYGSVEGPVTLIQQNNELTYATSKQLDLGIDLTIKNNIWLSVDAYSKNISDYIVLSQAPQYSGYLFKRVNGIDVKFTGLEFTLGWKKELGKVTWNSNLVAASLKSEIENVEDGITGYKEGESLSAIYAYKASGKFETVPYNSKTGNRLNFEGVPFQSGLPKINDTNNDQFIDAKDAEAIADSRPKFFGGWNNNFAYKNFYLDAQLYFMGGAEIVTESRVERYADNTYLNAQMQDNGELTPYYFLTNNGSGNVAIQGISSVDKVSLLRLNNLTLGYHFTPESFLGIKDINIYGTATNLFTVSSYDGSNPEENLNGIYQFDLGSSGTPLSTTIVLGVKVKF